VFPVLIGLIAYRTCRGLQRIEAIDQSREHPPSLDHEPAPAARAHPG
jgi:hypothetical protein